MNSAIFIFSLCISFYLGYKFGFDVRQQQFEDYLDEKTKSKSGFKERLEKAIKEQEEIKNRKKIL